MRPDSAEGPVKDQWLERLSDGERPAAKDAWLSNLDPGDLLGPQGKMPPARLALFDQAGIFAEWDWETRAFRQEGRAPQGRPTAWFEITTACDQVCRHCFMWERLRHGHVPAAHVYEALEAAAGWAPGAVVLAGGEPTLHPEFASIVARAAQVIGRVRVLTNGRSHSAEVIRALLRPGVRVDVPLLGWGADHEYMTGVPGSFDRAIGTIRALSEAGVPVTMTTTLTRFGQAASGRLEALAGELGVPFQPSELFRLGRAEQTWDEIAPEAAPARA